MRCATAYHTTVDLYNFAPTIQAFLKMKLQRIQLPCTVIYLVYVKLNISHPGTFPYYWNINKSKSYRLILHYVKQNLSGLWNQLICNEIVVSDNIDNSPKSTHTALQLSKFHIWSDRAWEYICVVKQQTWHPKQKDY